MQGGTVPHLLGRAARFLRLRVGAGRATFGCGNMSLEAAKRAAGYQAVEDHVRSGMVVGLGTGSTAYFAVERVGQKIKDGQLTDIVCIPTSERTREQAAAWGIPLCTLSSASAPVDVAIDGADAVDPDLCLIKGGGGALLREKMVEVAANKFICIVDETKLCAGLGPSFPLPVEITPFCHEHTVRQLAALPELAGCTARLRTGDCSNNKPDGHEPAVTDNGNYIVDLHFSTSIPNVCECVRACVLGARLVCVWCVRAYLHAWCVSACLVRACVRACGMSVRLKTREASRTAVTTCTCTRYQRPHVRSKIPWELVRTHASSLVLSS